MKNDFSCLFERTYIGKLGVKNRIVMAPMGAGTEMTGAVEEGGLNYYEARAKGGTGMIIVGNQAVYTKHAPYMAGMFAVDTPIQATQWGKLVDRVKGYGCAVCLQLTPGFGRNAAPIPGFQNESASENSLFFDPSQKTYALSRDQIHDIVASFGRAATRAKAVGVDAIEIHGHLGYLIDQFMTELWNRREDEYGGNFENRMRFPTEIYNQIRKAVGPDFPILFRMGIDHKFEGGRKPEESLKIIRYLDELGIDAFDIDDGCYDSFDWCFPPVYHGDACMADTAASVKAVTKKPVLNTGSFTPESAVKAVKEGKTDFIMLGRGLMCEPEWANKLLYGHREDVRPCIRCNLYCLTKTYAGIRCDFSCGLNAACSSEEELQLVKTENPQKVAVIGGGPGGMEAARVAALRGHRVTLYEKTPELGGQIKAASTPSFKSPLREYITYLKTQLTKLGVEVKLNTPINADSPELVAADSIIVAVGATPIIPKIPGVDNAKILEVMDAHLGDQKRIGGKVVVAGGGMSGCDCAIELAMEGKDVILVEMLDQLCPKAASGEKLAVNKKLREHGVKVLTGHKILAFTDIGVKAVYNNKEIELPADTVILAIGTKPESEIAKAIMDKHTNATSIGDCVEIGQIGDAVRRGYFAGRAV